MATDRRVWKCHVLGLCITKFYVYLNYQMKRLDFHPIFAASLAGGDQQPQGVSTSFMQ